MLYEVLLGIDRAARDTGKRITTCVRENDTLSAAIAAEAIADKELEDPATMYTHAMRVRPVIKPVPAAAMPLAMAA